jgi:hypothetical protein
VNGGWLRAAGAEEIVRPRRLIGRFWAALNFTVRPLLEVVDDVHPDNIPLHATSYKCRDPG